MPKHDRMKDIVDKENYGGEKRSKEMTGMWKCEELELSRVLLF